MIAKYHVASPIMHMCENSGRDCVTEHNGEGAVQEGAVQEGAVQEGAVREGRARGRRARVSSSTAMESAVKL